MDTQEKRWLVGLAVVAGFLSGAISSRIFAPEPSLPGDVSRRAEALYAERFVLVDKAGNVRADLSLHSSGGAALSLKDEQGRTRGGFVLRDDGQPSLGLFGRDGVAGAILAIESSGRMGSGPNEESEGIGSAAGVTGPFLRLRGSDGKSGLFLGVSPSPQIMLLDDQGKNRMQILLTNAGTPTMSLLDQEGIVRGEFGLYVDGSPVVSFVDKKKKGRLGMLMNTDGSTRLGMVDGEGKVIWSAP